MGSVATARQAPARSAPRRVRAPPGAVPQARQQWRRLGTGMHWLRKPWGTGPGRRTAAAAARWWLRSRRPTARKTPRSARRRSTGCCVRGGTSMPGRPECWVRRVRGRRPGRRPAAGPAAGWARACRGPGGRLLRRRAAALGLQCFAPPSRRRQPVGQADDHHHRPGRQRPPPADERRQPGPVPNTAAMDPTFMMAEYAPVTADTRFHGTSRRISTGTTMLPSVMATAMIAVPANTTAAGPSERITVPARTPPRHSSTVASGPHRRMVRVASGVANAKISTGRPVSRPAPAAVKPMSAWMSPRTAVGAMIGARKLTASMAMPRTTHGNDGRKAKTRSVAGSFTWSHGGPESSSHLSHPTESAGGQPPAAASLRRRRARRRR